MPNLLSIRLLAHQLASPQFKDPVDVVAHMGAIQAQDYRMSRWAVAMRTKKPSHEVFRQAFDSGRIIRMHLHRCTWQLLTAEDYPWMFPLCAPNAMSGLKGWMSANKVSIPDDERQQIGEIICQTTSVLRSATWEDYDEALRNRGIEMPKQRLSYHIRLGELGGTLCSGDLHKSKATYSLVSEKIGQTTPIDRDEALRRLAVKYFQSHSPATLEDFSWWSGLGLTDCRNAIQMLGSELDTIRLRDREFYVHGTCRTAGFRKGRPLLIAPYDEYLIGYKSRDLALASERRHHAHSENGIFYPVIAEGGRITGNWTPWGKDLGAEFFEPSAADEASLDKAWQEFQKFKKEMK